MADEGKHGVLIKLLVAAVVVLALMFVGLLWLVAVLAHISLWIPGAVTGVLVLAAIATLIWRRMSARSAARGLEKALAQQAKVQANVTRPDMRVEIQHMASEFDKAVQALKGSRLARGSGSDALYLLPWYAIIGPPGAGKSTALRNSGLEFPYLSANGGGVRGLGGTRNCDWWMTNHAVILDTAGRWTTQEEDHDEWIAFLEHVKKHRPRKPLNGLIVAISIQDLLTAHEEQVTAIARRVRERLDEVMGQLRVSLPVYVLFTKCDLVQGFTEMFGDLPKSERGQVWGFTVPLATQVAQPGAYFGERFDELLRMLEQRSLLRMPEERHVEMRRRIFELPTQLSAARQNLGLFIGSLFQPSVYDETPTMRGVYLTSGTQEGRPMDLMMSRLAQSMGIRGRAPVTTPVVDAKSYFLRDVFMSVVFEDRDVASASEVELRRRRLARIAITSVLTVIALVFSVVPTLAWGENRRLLRATERVLAPWDKTRAAPEGPRAPVSPAALEPLQQRAALSAHYEEDGVPWSLGFGMYQGDTLAGPMQRLLARLIGHEVVEPIVARDVQHLSDFGWKYESLARAQPSTEEHARFYDLLKLHLAMTGPRAEGEPSLTEDEALRTWVAEQLAARWLEAAGPEAKGESKRLVETIGVYLAALQTDASLILPRDADLVRRARAALTRVPMSQRLLGLIVDAVKDEGYELNLDRMVGATFGIVTGRNTVRGAFTRRAWDAEVRTAIESVTKLSGSESWVLAEAGDAASRTEAQLSELRSAYFRAYTEEWQEFIRGLRVQPAESSTDALAMLQTLTRGQPPPLGMIIQRIAYNVSLSDPEVAPEGIRNVAEGVLDKVTRQLTGWAGEKQNDAIAAVQDARKGRQDEFPIGNVARAFEGFTRFGAPPPPAPGGGPGPTLGLDIYQEQLQYIRDALQMQVDDPEQSEALMTRLQGARTRVRALIEEQEVGYRPLFEVLLWPPVESASLTSSLALATSAGRSWCTEVVLPHSRTLDGRYPFDPRGQDASLADFTRFFAPADGVLWQFYKESLEQRIEREGDRFVFRTKLGSDASAAYSSALLPFLQRASDITTVFFAQGEAQPRVDFEVRIHPSPTVATIQLSVGGKVIDYHNGPETWSKLSWPGESPVAGAGIVVRGANGMNERIAQEGDWGLFRLLDSGSVKGVSTRQFTVAWQLRTHHIEVAMDIRPQRSESPFFGIAGRFEEPHLFDTLRVASASVPKQIVVSGSPCRVR